ncbi:type I restriction-modification system endonuclease [Halobacillus sp. Nhm2S1]|uniref:type I restriction-modification system endonuclease n=1 Tax=Halobacillus sp. Nhm2S1 TaxID=2866716 RepID=UPI001C737BA6|nr:type I restriction-modification system endonuclease [Halobacillus sp. Nhm2S1]MBX0359159.1 type I restriction-modification system endonuclease [Halobacillus sp. Nhm2S1]
MQKSNFEFLNNNWSILANLGETAERNVENDPNTSLIKLRMLGETLTKYIYAYEEIKESYDTRQTDRLAFLRSDDLLTSELYEILNTIRRKGNKAVHEAGYGTTEEAKSLLHMAYQLSVWFMQVYGEWDFSAPKYIEPQPSKEYDEELVKLAQSYEEKTRTLQEELTKLQKQQLYKTDQEKDQRKQMAKRYGLLVDFTEAETRMIIDDKLQQAGWEVDSENLRYSKGVRPEKGRNLAIAEWPLKRGYADYALFAGLEFVGIIEAKRGSKDIPSDLQQAKSYAKQVVQKADEVIHEPWGDYQVPFLFATNGRPYLQQLEEKSGIWFLDARKSTNHPRPLKAWYSPEGLRDLLKQDVQQSTKDLEDETMNYLGLRHYQQDAIMSVEKALRKDQREILLAMATGTGKTRMAIGLIYRLIKTKRFKRILFLVDRSALGRQAEAAFKDSKLENLQSFTQIFNLQSLEDKDADSETKVHIATVQGMVKRLFYSEVEENVPTVDKYDCIVVDEAHRGYTLDKEMTDVELTFRDHNDYVSKYRQVLDYFDAVRIGLTATPALHTVEIFGDPVYNYSYREAVIDGYLIDHEPPYQFDTELKQKGIGWQVGEEVSVYDSASGQVETEVMEDEVNIEVTQFNKSVITENFNKVILNALANYIHPDQEGKTLIFAASDDHADMVVRLFKQELEEKYGAIDDNLVMKITGSIKDPLGTIKHFKNERLPKIAVTVDLLTTGIDVPSISNLVFLRRVRSRILYEQMLGRATRRHDEIGKDHFDIFDAVGLYESLKPYTSMKPVVKSSKVTLDQLFKEYEQLEDEKQQKQHKEEMIAKIQRKKQKWDNKEHEDFKSLSGGKSVDDFINVIKHSNHENTVKEIKKTPSAIQFIDENRNKHSKQYISDHEDKLLSISRGYGEADKPEDYLESFNQFIEENMNQIPALKLVVTRPRDLTRENLRQLRIALDQMGYNETNLQAAWRDAKNEDIAADIISFIRQQAIGDPLVSHEERIKNAMKKVYSMKVWPKAQKDWLQRIEKQLLKESILDPDPERAFNVEPFKSRGGYKQLNIIFNGELDSIVEKINTALYDKREQA